MSANSRIEWTDHTFNPWMGCTKVSAGCANCYAERREEHRLHRVKWGQGQPRRRTTPSNWKEPVKWNKLPLVCDNCGGAFKERCHHYTDNEQTYKCPNIVSGYRRPRVFCASLADWLDAEVPIEWLADLLKLIHETPNLDWLLLTKRPENWRARVGLANDTLPLGSDVRIWVTRWVGSKALGLTPQPPPNVWLGTSVEDQKAADERIPELLKIPAAVRFLSCEPLLGSADISDFLPWKAEHQSKGLPSPLSNALAALTDVPGIDWVIAGGESGPKARPMHPDWARGLRDQCAAAGVPFFFKQWGEWAPTEKFDHRAKRMFLEIDGKDSTLWDVARHSATTANMQRVGKKAAGRLLDGKEHNALPRQNGTTDQGKMDTHGEVGK